MSFRSQDVVVAENHAKDEARCARASELLRSTSRPIEQVAQAVGFRNDKSFARAFRQWTGLAPSALRAANKT